MTVRKEVHTRMSFAYNKGCYYYKLLEQPAKSGNLFTCRVMHKLLKARRIYVHYQNEYQRCQGLKLSK